MRPWRRRHAEILNIQKVPAQTQNLRDSLVCAQNLRDSLVEAKSNIVVMVSYSNVSHSSYTANRRVKKKMEPLPPPKACIEVQEKPVDMEPEEQWIWKGLKTQVVVKSQRMGSWSL